MRPFPSIEQFRHVIRQVKDRAAFNEVAVPELTFEGTVKLHGTNAGILFKDGKIFAQSRSRIITPGDDNYGFALWVSEREERLAVLGRAIRIMSEVPESDELVLYGEWAGKGIQSGVGISNHDKKFYIFAARAFSPSDDEETARWIDLEQFKLGRENNTDIRFLHQFTTWTMAIDFNFPERAQNNLVKITEQVEGSCPVAGGGIGEGVVWKCVTPGWTSSRFWFKVKGEKHSSSKVKVLAEVDMELAKSIDELADRFVTESRLQQAFETVGRTYDPKKIGEFIKWMNSDIYKEEKDVIDASGLDWKAVARLVGIKSKVWYEKTNSI